MALTVTVAQGMIQVTTTAEDWDSATAFPSGLNLKGIRVWNTAVGDVAIVRNASATGVVIFGGKDATGGGMKDDYPGGLVCKPYIKFSDQTFGTAANVKIVFFLY